MDTLADFGYWVKPRSVHPAHMAKRSGEACGEVVAPAGQESRAERRIDEKRWRLEKQEQLQQNLDQDSDSQVRGLLGLEEGGWVYVVLRSLACVHRQRRCFHHEEGGSAHEAKQLQEVVDSALGVQGNGLWGLGACSLEVEMQRMDRAGQAGSAEVVDRTRQRVAGLVVVDHARRQHAQERMPELEQRRE